MESRYVFLLIVIFNLFDALALNSSFFLLHFLGIINGTSGKIFLSGTFLIVFNLSWLISAIVNRLYKYKTVQSAKEIRKRFVYTFIGHNLIVTAYLFFAGSTFNNTIRYIFCMFLIEVFAFLLARIIIYLSETFFFKAKPHSKRIAILGYNGIGQKLEEYFLQHKLAFNFSGYFTDVDNPVNDDNPTNDNKLNTLKNSIHYAIENHLDEVYSTLFPENCEGLSKILELAEQHCVRVKFATSFIQYLHEAEKFDKLNYNLICFYGGIPILDTRIEPLSLLKNRILKRFFDVVFSLLIIIFILSWLMPVIMIIIKLESAGPVIFSQLRSGKDNKPFWCYKFRSMHVNNVSNEQQATKNDSRVTKTGAFMRRTSIDELPQFFNVLLGNMSVVGPRPHMLKHTEEYRFIIDKYMVRHFLKPGITGWAQVNGYRGETRNHDDMLKRVEHDIWYLENWSILEDVRIIVKTVLNAVTGEENAY
jgi:putative colanic acid biosynthesis UDP-glucose lipid carrier transferase